MSKCKPENRELINKIELCAVQMGIYKNNVKCFYNASEFRTKRDYVLVFICPDSWDSYDTLYLKKLMKNAGAIDIIGGKERKRCVVAIAFDEREV